MARVIALFIVMTFCVANVSFAAEQYKLRFKPRAKPLKILVKKRVDIYTTSWKYRRSHKLHQEQRMYKRHVTSGVPGILQLKLEETGAKVTLDGKVAPPLPGPKVLTMTISDQGEILRSLSNARAAKQTGLTLTFPEEPVSVGQIWTTTSTATDDYPRDITLHFKLTKVAKKLGKRCAVIETRVRESNTIAERGCRASLTIVGRILFDIDGGYVVRQRSSSTFITTFIEQRGKLPFQISRFSKLNKTAR